jgi:hypothetical protein
MSKKKLFLIRNTAETRAEKAKLSSKVSFPDPKSVPSGLQIRAFFFSGCQDVKKLKLKEYFLLIIYCTVSKFTSVFIDNKLFGSQITKL